MYACPTRLTSAVPPARFVGVAEESGLVLALGRWVLGEACRQAAAWRRDGADDLYVAVNISGRQLQGAGLADALRQTLHSSGVEPSAVVLEITESVLMQQTDAVLERLEQLKALGVRLAIDDFGTSYSSLSYLQRFPIDILKIAKPFVDEIGKPDAEPPILRAILDLADVFGLDAVAEGIEEPEQASRLVELGCALGQGHHLSEPLTAQAADDLILRSGLLGGATTEAPAADAVPTRSASPEGPAEAS